MDNDKITSNNNQEEKIALESNDAAFLTNEEIKQILKKKLNQGSANDETTPKPPTKKSTKK